ncbi:MAG: hypothetical protein ACTSXS_03255 [Candidatus Thorarchaeota archaeon]
MSYDFPKTDLGQKLPFEVLNWRSLFYYSRIAIQVACGLNILE